VTSLEKSNLKVLNTALRRLEKNRCFICNSNRITTKVSMWTNDGDEIIWCDVPSCKECKTRLESEDSN